MRPTQLRVLRAAAVVLLVACVDFDGLGPPLPATLRVRVTLPAGTPAAWTPSGETLHVALRRAGRVEAIVDTSFVVGDSLSATFTVPLAYTIERFVVLGEARYDGLLLFLGFDVVQLLAAGDTTITIAADYVGPGSRAASYSLGARDSTLGQGDTASLVPVVQDSAGLLIPNVPARYVASNPAVVAVDAAGKLTGQPGASDTARVTGYLPMGLSSSLVVRRVPVIPGTGKRTWLGNSAVWSDPNNWDPAGVPSASDTADVQDSGSSPMLDADVTVTAVRVTSGNLALNGHTLTVTDFSTENGLGTLTMLLPADTLRVLGRAVFQGASTADLLDNGVLIVGGDFQQRNDGVSRESFQAGDAHRTILAGSSAQRLRAEGDAKFGHLELANPAGVVGELEETVAIQYTLRVGAGTAFAGGDIALDVGDSLITGAGSSLVTARVRLAGAMAVAGTFNPTETEFAGDSQVIQPGLDYQQVTVSGRARLDGPTAFASLFVGGGDANLDLNGQRLTVAGGVEIGGSSGKPVLGTLTMQRPADTLIVAAALIWGDGAGAGLMTAGVIRARGLVGSAATEETGAFEPSGSHRTVLESSAPQLVALESAGSFNDLVLANAAGDITLGSPTTVRGTLTVAGALPQRVTSSANILRAGGVDVVGLTLDATTLTISLGPIVRFDSVTFQNQSPTEAQLTINHAGGTAPFTFTGLRFLTTPSTGAYVSATDDVPVDGNVLTIALVGSQPPNGASKTVTANGAIVTWDGAPPPPLGWSQVSAGLSFTCGLSTANVAYCWGSNTDGQLGDGTHSNRSVPTLVLGGLAFTQISAGGGQACALTGAGAAYCWGANASGQLGDGTNTERTAPVAVAGGLTFASVSAGDQYACGLTTGGQVYCWGRNVSGRLGDSTLSDRYTPVPVVGVGGLAFASVVAGLNNPCALTTTGAAYCWGFNLNGQLGDGTTTDRRSPTLVLGGLTFSQIVPSADHACGVTTGGLAYCWGWNNYGQLGDGSTTSRTSPVAVAGGLFFASIGIGGNGFTCGLTTANAAYCWGLNNVGQLGDGTQSNHGTPGAVLGGLTFSSLRVGFAHVAAITPAGAGYAWGGNTQGQLGDGTATLRTTPVPISPP